MSKCDKCGGDMMRQGPNMHMEECRNALRAELETTKARLAEVERERDEAREDYHRLDDNWATLHNAGMNALRVALHMPDATVPEMVERIAATPIEATGGKETK